MDALKLLAEKNKKHAELLAKDNREARYLYLCYLSFAIVTGFEIFIAAEPMTIGPLKAAGASFLYSISLAIFGSDLIVRHWLRVILLVCCQVWFVYFWVWAGEPRSAFLPLGFVLILWRKWFYWNLFKKLRNDV